MSYSEAKAKYAALGIDTDAAIERLKTVPVSGRAMMCADLTLIPTNH